MNPAQYILVQVLGIWLLILGLSVLGGRGEQFAKWSWRVVSHPFRSFWGHYGSYILTLLVGIAIGVANAPAIHQFLGH